MKTTIDIAEPVLQRTKELARHRHVTLRMLVEEGLAKVIAEGAERSRPFKLRKTRVGGGGFTAEFAGAGWDVLRDEIYRGRGT